MVGQNETLDNFQGWDNGGSDDDFFKDLENSNNNEIVDDNPITAPENKDDSGDTEKDLDLDSKINDLFDDELDTLSENTDSDQSKSNAYGVLKYLQEKGIVTFDDGEDISEDNADELFEDKFESAVENRVKSLFEELPDTIKQLNAFVIKGGNPMEFFQSLSQGGDIDDELDLDDEEIQELIVRTDLEDEGHDEDYIETQIEFLRDSKKLKMFAEKKYERRQEIKKKQREDLVRRQAERQKEIQKEIKEAKKNIEEYLSENQSIEGMVVPKKDIKDLPSYVTDRSVKLQNGSSISQLQRDLYYELPKNEKAYLQLATLMKNRNEDGTFNFDFLLDKDRTKFVKNLRDNMRRNEKSLPKGSKNKSTKTQRSLADYFN